MIQFQLLASTIFREQNSSKIEFLHEDNNLTDLLGLTSSDSKERCLHARRTKLFDELSEFFPKSLTHPRANLLDLLPL